METLEGFPCLPGTVRAERSSAAPHPTFMLQAVARAGLLDCATCSTIGGMRTAGIREARQGLSSLVAEVRKGREIVLTEHGRPVARLAPVRDEASSAFRSHRRFRLALARAGVSVAKALEEDREDRV
jgi:prevent-host-death family protein